MNGTEAPMLWAFGGVVVSMVLLGVAAAVWFAHDARARAQAALVSAADAERRAGMAESRAQASASELASILKNVNLALDAVERTRKRARAAAEEAKATGAQAAGMVEPLKRGLEMVANALAAAQAAAGAHPDPAVILRRILGEKDPEPQKPTAELLANATQDEAWAIEVSENGMVDPNTQERVSAEEESDVRALVESARRKAGKAA